MSIQYICQFFVEFCIKFAIAYRKLFQKQIEGDSNPENTDNIWNPWLFFSNFMLLQKQLHLLQVASNEETYKEICFYKFAQKSKIWNIHG